MDRVHRDREPLVFGRAAHQVAPPHRIGAELPNGMCQVQEHLGAVLADPTPLLGESEIAAQLHAQDRRWAGSNRKLVPKGQDAPLVGGQVHLVVPPPGVRLRTQYHRAVGPAAPCAMGWPERAAPREPGCRLGRLPGEPGPARQVPRDRRSSRTVPLQERDQAPRGARRQRTLHASHVGIQVPRDRKGSRHHVHSETLLFSPS